MHRYYTVKEVAQMFRVKEPTIYYWIKKGKIKAIKIGKKWLIPEEEIFKLINGRFQ